MTTRSTKKPKISAESIKSAANEPTTSDLYYQYINNFDIDDCSSKLYTETH